MEVRKQNIKKSPLPRLAKKSPYSHEKDYLSPKIAHTIQKRPLKSLLIAGGIGYLISALWRK